MAGSSRPGDRSLALLSDQPGDRRLVQLNGGMPASLRSLLDDRGDRYLVREHARRTLVVIWLSADPDERVAC
jgi:hypothetical protein